MSDEAYVLELCDELLRTRALRRHRFHFLRGADGRRVPVGAFYPALRLVIEYREAPAADDRQAVLAKFGVRLLELNPGHFGGTAGKRLLRAKAKDSETLKALLASLMRDLARRGRVARPSVSGR